MLSNQVTNPDTPGLVKRYRAQMLIHSYLYYVRDSSIISDHEFDRRAKRLVELQSEMGDVNIGFYDELFVDWTGASGYHLKYDDWVVSKAVQLERIHKTWSVKK